MNDLNRASLDMEIERIHKKMNETDPLSEEYEKLVKRCDTLMRSANDDDKVRAEAELEKIRIDLEEEKTQENKKWQKFGAIVSAASPVLASLTSVACYVILCIANKQAQERSILFEMDGYSHTDRSDKFMQKAPLPKF